MESGKEGRDVRGGARGGDVGGRKGRVKGRGKAELGGKGVSRAGRGQGQRVWNWRGVEGKEAWGVDHWRERWWRDTAGGWGSGKMRGCGDELGRRGGEIRNWKMRCGVWIRGAEICASGGEMWADNVGR